MATVEVPETRYARNGPVNLAYQVMGDGPIDVLYLDTGASHLDHSWQFPPYAHVFDRLASFCRLVRLDVRGTGLSDRTVEPPTIDEAVADAVAVLDELHIEVVHLLGYGDGGARALAMAAAHPDRVARLAVRTSPCCVVATDDFPWGYDPSGAEMLVASAESSWGGTGMLEIAAPSQADDPEAARWYTAYNRASVAPPPTRPGSEASWRSTCGRFCPTLPHPSWSSLAPTT